MLWPFMIRQRRRRALATAPITAIAALEVGARARIRGRVRPYDGPERAQVATLRTMAPRGDAEQPFPATYTGRPCVYVAAQARDVEGRVTAAVTAGVRFVVVDATGAAIVDLAHAVTIDDLIEVVPRAGTFMLHAQCLEWALAVDDHVTVLATAVAGDGLITLAGTPTAAALVSTEPALAGG